MYRVSPLTYFVSGVLSVGFGNANIMCAREELLRFAPPAGQDCFSFLQNFVEAQGGYLSPETANSTEECTFCTGSDTNTFLRNVSAEYQDRWRNFGIVWAYVVINVVAAMSLYWLTRVPKKGKALEQQQQSQDEDSAVQSSAKSQ